MNLLNKYHKLFLCLFAVLAIGLAGSHFCSAFNHASAHHSDNQSPLTSVTYTEKSNFQQCCTNKSGSQLTNPIQQVQKFNLDTQSSATTALYASSISYAVASSIPLQSAPQLDKPDPGGGLVLRC